MGFVITSNNPDWIHRQIAEKRRWMRDAYHPDARQMAREYIAACQLRLEQLL